MPVKLSNRKGIYYAMGTLTLPSGVRVEIRQSTGFSTSQRQFAEQQMAAIIQRRIEEDAKPSAGPNLTVAEAVRKYAVGKPNMARGNYYILDSFEREFGKLLVKDLGKIEVREWAERGRVKNNTIRRRLITAIACLNYVRDYGFNVPELKIKKPPEDDHRDRWLGPEARDRFIDGFKGVYYDIAAFLFYTGARLDEALTRKVEHILPDGILLESRKGRGRKLRRRVVPLHDSLRGLLEARTAHLKAGDYIFSQKAMKKVSGRWFREHWHKVCAAQGVEDFVPHDARHTFATLLAKTGDVDLQELAHILGHSDLRMVLKYRHLLPRRQAIGIASLGVLRTRAAQGSKEVADDDVPLSKFLALSVDWSVIEKVNRHEPRLCQRTR